MASLRQSSARQGGALQGCVHELQRAAGPIDKLPEESAKILVSDMALLDEMVSRKIPPIKGKYKPRYDKRYDDTCVDVDVDVDVDEKGMITPLATSPSKLPIDEDN